MTTAAPDKGASTATTDTGASALDAGPGKDPAAQAGADTGTKSTGADGAVVLEEIRALVDELGITPGQLKGRLEASRKWETRAKQADTVKTQAEAVQQQLSQVAKVLGLAPDDAPTPEKLQAAVTERDELIAGMRLERAVERAARDAGGDVDLVVPALMYSGKLDGLDPNAEDFPAKLAGVVKDLVEKNPKYRAGDDFPDLAQGNRGPAPTGASDPNAWIRRMAGRA